MKERFEKLKKNKENTLSTKNKSRIQKEKQENRLSTKKKKQVLESYFFSFINSHLRLAEMKTDGSEGRGWQ